MFGSDSTDGSAQVQLVQIMAEQHAETDIDAAQVKALIQHVQDKGQTAQRLIA